ncbi:hypothetical protein CMI37_07295 [Candidatus Pacearchaeota archaeon]|nr:hypothetical protein [Candidatus Pacearchaeota archaeon]|tara:strand:+ start:3033 stop:3230 length:198 start_codon:yes stop_codon:yes gene_type:complete
MGEIRRKRHWVACTAVSVVRLEDATQRHRAHSGREAFEKRLDTIEKKLCEDIIGVHAKIDEHVTD